MKTCLKSWQGLSRNMPCLYQLWPGGDPSGVYSSLQPQTILWSFSPSLQHPERSGLRWRLNSGPPDGAGAHCERESQGMLVVFASDQCDYCARARLQKSCLGTWGWRFIKNYLHRDVPTILMVDQKNEQFDEGAKHLQWWPCKLYSRVVSNR